MKKLLILFGVVLMCAGIVNAQISVTTNTYSENFDGMGSSGTSLPNGWAAIRGAGSGTVGANLTMAVTDGSANSGNVYNVGTTSVSERALGTLASGTTSPYFGANFTNNTNGTITQLNFSGVMEQWRSGSNSSVNEVVVFEYSFDATGLNDGTWTALSGMDFNEKLTSTTAAAAVDGNNVSNQTSISATLNSINWTHGTSMWIRWKDADNTGSDGCYAIDDIVITNNSPLPVELTSFTATAKGRSVELAWKTATEKNNHGFEVQRSEVRNQKSEGNWTKVGFVDGAGNSNTSKEYSYRDNVPVSGKYLYRLKQVDNDGAFEYSSSVEVNASTLASGYELAQNHPNPFNPTTNIAFALANDEFVSLKVYDMLGKEIATLVNGKQSAGAYSVPFNASEYPSGIYFYTLRAGNSIETKKMLLVK